MALSDVKVIIELNKPTGVVSFGKPLIIAVDGVAQGYTEYASTDEVAAVYAKSSPVYLNAVAVFDQDARPDKVGIVTVAEATGIAAALTAVLGRDWYFVITPEREQATLITIADLIETTGNNDDSGGKMFVADVSTDAVATALKAKEYTRTIVTYNPNTSEHMAAALIGACGSAPVGSITWKFKTLRGITPTDVNTARLTTLHNLGVNAYVTKAGIPQTSEGRVVSGDFIDVMMSVDWVAYDIGEKTQRVFTNNGKVAYTDAGISMLEAATLTTLQTAYLNGMIAADGDEPLYGTSFAKRADVDPLDRAARIYNGGSFWFELAGAIHKTRVRGEVRF
jgi:hypothetical protein